MRRYFGMFINTKYKSGKGSNFVLEKLIEKFHDTEQVSYGTFEVEAGPDVTVKQIAEKNRNRLKEEAKKSIGSEYIDIDDIEVRIVEVF